VNLTRWLAVAAAVIGLSTQAPALSIEGVPMYGACPYDFRSDMPPGEYCVYRGIISSPAGTICNGDAVLIWSTHAERPTEQVSTGAAVGRDVFFGFVDEPSLVMHAVAVRRTHARMVDYSPGTDQVHAPLDGVATLLRQSPGWGGLTMKVRPSISLAAGEGACDFAAYRGLFVGLMRQPDPNGPSRPPD
jgi:hypothetical protein